MKAVMYHYVRRKDLALPNFRYLDIENFRKQLDFFADNHGFVERADWEDYAAGNVSLANSEKVLLTFDDGTSCHYNHVFPELKKRGLWGIFFVPAQPHLSRKTLDVHRVHLLCARFDGTMLLARAKTFLKDRSIAPNRDSAIEKATYQHQQNYPAVTQFKRLVNYQLTGPLRSSLIDHLEDTFGGCEIDIYDYYASPEQLETMSRNGMVLGSHTVTHPVMSHLDRADQSDEIDGSIALIHDIAGRDTMTFCHPYGGVHSFNYDTLELLEKSDVGVSFSVESRDIVANDVVRHPHALPRFDCNEFAFGEAS